MAEQILGTAVEKGSGPAVIAALGAIFTKMVADLEGTLPVPTVHLLTSLVGIGTLISIVICWRYVGVLEASAAPGDSIEKKAYNRLRRNVLEGGTPARLYARWLAVFLDAVERFFGDVGMTDRTLFPRAFGLRKPAPLWTAPAFDRCLLLALIYPIATILGIWAISGHAGPAEHALGLTADVAGWQRGILVTGLAVPFLVLWRVTRISSLWDIPAVAGAIVFFVASVAAGAGAVGSPISSAIALAIALDVAIAGTLGGPGAVAVTFAVAIAVALEMIAGFDGAPTWVVHVVLALTVAVALAITLATSTLYFWAENRERKGAFLSFFIVVAILVCLGSTLLLTDSPSKIFLRPTVLFLGLLTLLNAPFDWASLGATRALLRRGLERAGWWPMAYALADALLAAVIIALLAFAMVLGVQAFDDLAAYGGGERVLPLDDLFGGIEHAPQAPEHWWVYALLLSTMIPSLLNLMIGGASIMRGVPGVPSLLLRKMPAAKPVPAFDRAWIAIVLTLQLVLGAVVGVAVQAILAIGMLWYVMPWMGIELLHVSRVIAALDLPARLGMAVARMFGSG